MTAVRCAEREAEIETGIAKMGMAYSRGGGSWGKSMLRMLAAKMANDDEPVKRERQGHHPHSPLANDLGTYDRCLEHGPVLLPLFESASARFETNPCNEAVNVKIKTVVYVGRTLQSDCT